MPQMTDKEIEQRSTHAAELTLKGKTIKAVRYMTKKEADEMGWRSRPIAIFFTDGSFMFPSADDEGNNGGALFGTTKGGSDFVIPVI